MVDLPPVLAPLVALERARKSIAEYYVPLTRDADEVVRVAAFQALIARNALPFALYEAAADHARYGALRQQAFDYFQSVWEHGLAARVADAEVVREDIAERALADAQLACNDEAAERACRALYLSSGDLGLLDRELDCHRNSGGIEAGLALAVRNLIINPHDPLRAYRLLELCLKAGRADLIDATVAALLANDLHPRIAAVFAGWASLLRGDPKDALRKLQQAGSTRATAKEATLLLTRSAQRLNAESLEKLGDARAAFAAYQQLNQSAGEPDIAGFRRRVLATAKIPVPELPAEDRSNWLTITGFPRSGATVLQAILAAHPALEIFTDPPTLTAMQLFLERILPQSKSEPERAAAFAEARQRYYAEMERRRKKPHATVFLEQALLRSADAAFMTKVFPDRRYVFLVCHPFDVVLSCFRNALAANALENFRTVEAAVNLYDFAMTQWFAAFAKDDRRVHYVKYENLVTQSEPQMPELLHFLGLEWQESLMHPATPNEAHPGWRKYPFVFQAEATAPLKKWAEFFGYPTK